MSDEKLKPPVPTFDGIRCGDNPGNVIEYDAPTRISWFRVFNDLKVGGWSLYRIEAEMGVAKTTLLGWKSGAEPRHADGEILISLWQAVTSKSRENLPTEKRFENAYHRK